MSRSSYLAKKRLVSFFHWKHWKATLELFVAVSAIISMLLVYFTLREMQIERDNAYRIPCPPDFRLAACRSSVMQSIFTGDPPSS
jgi:hypothetical protein